jgi:lipoprotein-anchoring transpeptidase ErfK/SrfK
MAVARAEREESERELGPMIIARLLGNASIAAGAIVAAMSFGSGPASAQLFWDWGGGGTIGGSGREFVRFSPQFKRGEIVVSFGDRRLYFVTAPGQAISYPIAVPREESRWAGMTSVTSKRINPSWTPTPTMMAENPRLPRWVPGGHPMNPLGVRALYLGSSTYRIHGTDAPWTIGTAVSKGCIRMYNQDVLDLYPRANVGAKVTVTWNRFDGGATTSSTGNGGGGFFSIFSNEDPPTEKPRPRPARAKSASSS